MSRPLTPAEAAAALRRGAEIEQFLSLVDGEVRYLTGSRSGRGFVLRAHHVHDDGHADFADLSEFAPVDDEEHVGEGRKVADVATAEEVVAAARRCGGSDDRWVSQGMASDAYVAAKRT